MKRLLSMRNKKGFTLIEIIIVLIILAVIAAIAIPSMIGFIQQANDSQIITEGRSVLLAGQVIATKLVGQGNPNPSSDDIKAEAEFWAMLEPDIPGINPDDFYIRFTLARENGRITELSYRNPDRDRSAAGRILEIDTARGVTEFGPLG